MATLAFLNLDHLFVVIITRSAVSFAGIRLLALFRCSSTCRGWVSSPSTVVSVPAEEERNADRTLLEKALQALDRIGVLVSCIILFRSLGIYPI
jgi:hypothetical protein